MKVVPLGLFTLIAILSMSQVCLAHKVNVFAFVDGDHIQVECGFSRSQKVKNGRLVVTDLETGDVVHEGVTDDKGVYRFRPSDDFLQTGHGLNIQLYAGEGHQDDWKVSAEELQALSDFSATAAKDAVSGRPTPDAAAPLRQSADTGAAPRQPPSTFDAAELEAIVARVVDDKLAPVKQALARQEDSGPGLRDIVGGIGWILGLLGLATYLKYRR